MRRESCEAVGNPNAGRGTVNSNSREDMYREQKRRQRKYSSVLLEEIMHMNSSNSTYGFLMTLSLVKEDFPWLYDMGKELVNLLDNSNSTEHKTLAIKDFRQMLDFVTIHSRFSARYFRAFFARKSGAAVRQMRPKEAFVCILLL